MAITNRRSCVAAALAAALAPAQQGAAEVTAGCPPIVFGPPHESLHELALRTLERLFEEGGLHESGGFFIEQDGSYAASRPVTQRAPRSVHYCIVLPRDTRLAGIYHTHVVNAALSGRDRSNAERAGVPSYIGTLRDRSVLVYDGQRRESYAVERTSRTTIARVRDSEAAARSERGARREGVDPDSWSGRFAAVKRRVLDLLGELAKSF